MPICSAFNYENNKNKLKWNIFAYVSAENLDIHIDAVEQGGASPSQNVIGKENVEDRRGTSAQEVLARMADRYIQRFDPSDEEGYYGFLRYMTDLRRAIGMNKKKHFPFAVNMILNLSIRTGKKSFNAFCAIRLP